MKIRIEVIDEDIHKATDIIEDITCDLFNKYPAAEANLDKITKGNLVEFLIKNKS